MRQQITEYLSGMKTFSNLFKTIYNNSLYHLLDTPTAQRLTISLRRNFALLNNFVALVASAVNDYEGYNK